MVIKFVSMSNSYPISFLSFIFYNFTTFWESWRKPFDVKKSNGVTSNGKTCQSIYNGAYRKNPKKLKDEYQS